MGYPSSFISQGLFYGTVALFTLIGIWAGRRGVADKDVFLTARSTQGWLSLGINLFAAGLGVWTFFALPQVGSDTGLLGVFAYAFSIVVPILILTWLGPILRRKLPGGVTITEFILCRYGLLAHIVTNCITLLYMSVFLVTELTALGFLVEAYGINVLTAQIVVCASTALYTCISGMKASLLTDKFQGWIVLILMVIVSIAFGASVKVDPRLIESTPLLKPSQIAWESIYTLTVANLSANLFHQGYWQRVYSAQDDNELRKASILASILTFPVIFLIGLTGVFSVWAGFSELNDPLAFFNITATLPTWTNALVLILALSFVASSVDTLQNALVATLVTDVFMNRVCLNTARLISVLINVPVIFVAAKGYNVISLFLIADLAAAVVSGPVVYGLLFGDHVYEKNALMDGTKILKMDGDKLWGNQIEPAKHVKLQPNGIDFCAAVFGGLFCVVTLGTIMNGGDVGSGFTLLSLPNGLSKSGESIGAFIAAPVGSLLFFFGSCFIRRLIASLFLANL